MSKPVIPATALSLRHEPGGPNSGTAENGTVRLVNDALEYPAVGEVVMITIMPTT